MAITRAREGSGYIRGTWERDEFSGFENRHFPGVGVAYKAIENSATKWTVEGGPGYRDDAVYTSDSTQLSNGIALRANLTGKLSARVSLDVRHDTNPPLGFEATDRSTRFSLVYEVE